MKKEWIRKKWWKSKKKRKRTRQTGKDERKKREDWEESLEKEKIMEWSKSRLEDKRKKNKEIMGGERDNGVTSVEVCVWCAYLVNICICSSSW